MPAQTELSELLPARRLTPVASIRHPQICVRDLIVVDALDRPAASKRVHLKLRRGLNILWARTGNEADSAANRLHGHSAGKTLFCRLLRYILDERRFGNEVVESQIQLRLPDAWVVGRVELDGVAWLVGRSILNRTARFATQTVTVEDFFNGAISPSALSPWRPFREALHAAMVRPLHRHDFPGHHRTIEWLDLLAWLSRDQECRMAKLTDWRATESISDSPGSDVAERQFLMRLVLGLLSPDESAEYDRVEKLNRQRLATERILPVLQDRVARDFGSLRALPLGLDAGLGEELFIDAARQSLEQKLSALKTEPELSPTATDIGAAENALRVATTARAAMEERQRGTQRHIAELGKKVSEWGEKKLQALNDEAQARFRPTSAYCGAPIEEAEREGCELAKQYRTRSFSAMLLSASFAREEADAITEKQNADAELTKIGAELAPLREREDAARQSLAAMRTIRDRNLKAREHRRAQLEIGQLTCSRAAAASKQLTLARATKERLNRAIEKSQRTQKLTRREVEKDRAAFSNLFDQTIREVLGEQVTGSVEFSGRDLVLHADQSGERTSAAIESIKVVCFDLAALMWSIEGNGWHPRFLIHDSPREADMDAAIYRRFFHVAHQLEKLGYSGGDAPFQYIITTTEPPPVELQREPWLICDPLDASLPEKRLLGLDL